MSIKVVYNASHGISLPDGLLDILRSHPVLGPLKGENNWFGYGAIPRHHPTLIQIVEQWISLNGPNETMTVEEILKPRYLITEENMVETLWAEKKFIDASPEINPNLLLLAPKDYSDPKWDVENRTRTWHYYVDDNVKVIWNTFSEKQKATLAHGFSEIATNECWD